MKKEELSPERIAVERLAREIHEANLKYERYTKPEFVIVTSIVQSKIGPWTLPGPFHIKQQDASKHLVCSITPSSESDDSVVMVDDGKVALRNPKTGRYEAFDFKRGSSEDFHTIKAAIEKWRRIPQNLHHLD